MNYCPRPLGRGQLSIELSKAPRGIVLTFLPNSHEITALLPNLTRNISDFIAKLTINWRARLFYARDIPLYSSDVDVIGHVV